MGIVSMGASPPEVIPRYHWFGKLEAIKITLPIRLLIPTYLICRRRGGGGGRFNDRGNHKRSQFCMPSKRDRVTELTMYERH